MVPAANVSFSLSRCQLSLKPDIVGPNSISMHIFQSSLPCNARTMGLHCIRAGSLSMKDGVLQVAPKSFWTHDQAGINVQRAANDLVDAAMNTRNLCRMDPTWHPWF